MSADQDAPGTPQDQPAEGDVLEVSAEELTPAALAPPPPAESMPPPVYTPPLPAAETGQADDVEVTLVPEPAAAVPAAPVTAAPVGVPTGPVPTGTVAAGGDVQWYTTSGGQVYGPYTAANLREWLKSGQVTWETQASRGGADPWRPLHQILEFNPSLGPDPRPRFVRKERVLAGILAIVLGSFGTHHWYLGNYAIAGAYLGTWLLATLIQAATNSSLLMISPMVTLCAVIEGVIYLASPEEKFQQRYKTLFLFGR